MFLIQIVPIIIASMAVNSTSIESCGCSFCSCFNIYAEFFRMAGFISLIYSCYKFKDMILDQRHNLLDNTQHVELEFLGKICLGHSSSMTADTMADYVLGRDAATATICIGLVALSFIHSSSQSSVLLRNASTKAFIPYLTKRLFWLPPSFTSWPLVPLFLSCGAFGSRIFLFASKLAMRRKTELGCGTRARCRWPRCRDAEAFRSCDYYSYCFCSVLLGTTSNIWDRHWILNVLCSRTEFSYWNDTGCSSATCCQCPQG